MILKWIFDRVVALVGLLFLWPVLLVVAIMVKVKMPGGPAFFCQQRAIGGNREGHIVFPSLLSCLYDILNARKVNESPAPIERNEYGPCHSRLGDKVVDGLNVALTECPTVVAVVALILA